MNKEFVYKYYGWKPEDGDYKEKDFTKSKHKVKRIERLVNLLISVFILNRHTIHRK
ncbi:MAG: hypothetical protein PHN88_02170 [Ignavibacteria bacterium]|nr:hypothetical protein [Ignavibacteria bacterium]